MFIVWQNFIIFWDYRWEGIFFDYIIIYRESQIVSYNDLKKDYVKFLVKCLEDSMCLVIGS